MPPETVKMVEVLPSRIWIESDTMDALHVVLQHGDSDPFTYASLRYDHTYTSNSGTMDAAQKLAQSFGATEPIEHRQRALPEMTHNELRLEV